MLSPELINILCCPVDKGDLTYDSGKDTLTCKKCGQVYQVKNGIPIMLTDDEPAP
jgi:uncharacterized protein YbaR (Trm112 family)